jgi:hypothetical protein
MNKGSGIKNRVKFRLTGTPDGDLLVTFYHLDVFNDSAVNYHIATQFLGGQFGSKVLYEGNLQNNTYYQPAIYRLAERIELYVNCARIERLA